MRRTTTLAALVAGAALALTGCQSADTDAGAEQGGGNQTANQADSGDAEQTEFSFGDTYDGPLKTTIAAPENVTTSEYAQPEGGAAAWSIEVTYENTLDQPYNIAMLGVDGYADDEKQPEVFDSQQGIGDAMETGEIAPGAKATVTYGFTGEPEAAKKVVVSSMDRSTQVTFTD